MTWSQLSLTDIARPRSDARPDFRSVRAKRAALEIYRPIVSSILITDAITVNQPCRLPAPTRESQSGSLDKDLCRIPGRLTHRWGGPRFPREPRIWSKILTIYNYNRFFWGGRFDPPRLHYLRYKAFSKLVILQAVAHLFSANCQLPRKGPQHPLMRIERPQMMRAYGLVEIHGVRSDNTYKYRKGAQVCWSIESLCLIYYLLACAVYSLGGQYDTFRIVPRPD
eukprot:1195271-Prorocentrum_minimum.AAC.8